MTAAPTDIDLRWALYQADALTGAAMRMAVALSDFDIELPPGTESRIDQAQMRAIASLYLAADLECAGVLPAVETLAGLARSGALSLDFGTAGAQLQAFWKARNQRATPEERAAFFGRLFGAANLEFEDRMLDLCEALYKLDELAVNATYGGTAQQARVRAAAQALAGNLVQAGGGITAFLAQEVLQSLREALAILASTALRSAFGAGDTWTVIAAIHRLAGVRAGDPAPFARRGKAGMTVLSWLAEAGPVLGEPAQPLVGLDHPVIGAAVEWLQTSLDIGERAPPASLTGRAYPPAPQSPWAAIGV